MIPIRSHFEVAPVHVIYELGAYSLPARFSHWTFGRDYHRQKTSYEYGMSKIYEIVFNTDPCQAFLMDSNSMTSHKLIIAHVIGHCHFFKHNDYFAHTDRQMIEKVRLHRDRIASYEQEFGWRQVEDFLDAVMCIEEHFDPTSEKIKPGPIRGADGSESGQPRTSGYDDLWKMMGDETPSKPRARKFPEEPEKDLLLFLSTYGRDLAPWQRDIIDIVREEMLYFLPQMRTKIMNEGFASLAHERILESVPDKVRGDLGVPQAAFERPFAIADARPDQPVLCRLSDSQGHRAPLEWRYVPRRSGGNGLARRARKSGRSARAGKRFSRSAPTRVMRRSFANI